ncbi:MAG: adenylate/guanylate cyclase domain-containing protein [Acidimicrobiia bacterium]|nr:adenylate/guanylate cyclase domain-containing protein [Acidimicrobiia bacterium]
MDALPSGVLTLLFTDIEQSSRLWDEHRSDMAVALVRHNELLKSIIAEHQGFVVKDKGDGFFAAFVAPADAVRCVVDAQRRLRAESWPDPVDIKVRMGLHTGAVEAHEGDYHGPTVNQVARIEGLAHGGQVLLSETTVALLGGDLPDGVGTRDLGAHTLKGISQPARVYQLTAPDLPEEFPPLVSSHAVGVPLPDFPTSFVGREDDRRALAGYFTGNGTRLVTLLGPGGIGKTRLAVEAAREVAPELGASAYFADLTSVQVATDVPGAIAAALGVRVEGAAPPVELIAQRISEPSLLVVDNFEHVQDAQGTVGELVNTVEPLRIMATSRTPLQVRGEKIYRLDPLGVAGGNGRRPPAVQLFYDRAADYGVDLADAGPEADSVHAIVERVDGLPLAIELVAARTRVLDVTELNARLQESMGVIGSGGAELPERQRTIRSTIDWSLKHVSESQRTLFRRLAALPAGASLDVLEAVAGTDLDEDLLDAVQGLVDYSLVQAVRGLPGGTRYRQLVPMREHGLDLLREAGEEEQVLGRLVDYFVDTAVERGQSFEFSHEPERELRVDHQNLLAAMRFSLDHSRAGDLAEAFNHFWVYWFNADIGMTALPWLAAAAEQVDTPYMDFLMGFFAFQQGDMESVGERMGRAIEGFSELGDQRALNRARWFAGAAHPDLTEGRRMLLAGKEYFDTEQDGISRFLPLLFLSINAVLQGDTAQVVELRKSLLNWAERADYRVLIAWGHWNLSLGYIAIEDFDAAESHARAALEMMVEDQYIEGMASALDLIGILESRAGNHERALPLFGAASDGFEKIQAHRWFESEMFMNQAIAAATEDMGEERVAGLLEQGRAAGLDEMLKSVESN